MKSTGKNFVTKFEYQRFDCPKIEKGPQLIAGLFNFATSAFLTQHDLLEPKTEQKMTALLL